MKKILIGVGIVLVALLVLGGIKAMQIGAMIQEGTAFKLPPFTVTSSTVEEQSWEQSLAAVGSVSPVEGADLRAEASGNVVEIAFDSGELVTQGQLLVKLDTRTEEAQLKAAEAAKELARLDLERSESLRASRTISTSEYDSARARYTEAEAQVENIQSIIDDKYVRAPFTGRTGIRRVNQGSFVNVGDHIVTLQSLQQVYVDFSLPQQVIRELRDGLEVVATVDSFPDREFRGKLTATSPLLDTATRTIDVQATFENPDELLRPGMFAKVRVIKPEKKQVLSIPSTAVLYAPYGNSVYIIEEVAEESEAEENEQPQLGAPYEHTGFVIRQQFVRTGESRGDFISILDGLKPGRRVVSEGVFKLQNNASVVISDSLALEYSLEPTPEEG